MAAYSSYMYNALPNFTGSVLNPSQKVTDLLSKFLDFDPKTLELGIWSGDLSLKNVQLKKDTIQPLLNSKRNSHNNGGDQQQQFDFSELNVNEDGNNPSGLNSSPIITNLGDPTKKNPLRVKLVRGTIGYLRIGIPWKQLVWGQGSVELEISDVTIVLSLQSREESLKEEEKEKEEERKERIRKEDNSDDDDEEDDDDDNDEDDGDNPRTIAETGSKRRKKKKKKKKDGHTKTYHRAYREAKQRRLREAERRVLFDNNNNNSSNKATTTATQTTQTTISVALWLEQIHKKRSIAKEAYRAEEQAKTKQDAAKKASTANAPTTAASRSSSTSTSTSAPTTAVILKDGKFDRYLKSFANSDLFWRLFAGVKGSIKNARIVLLQDGIEVGCIIQSIDVIAGVNGIEINQNNNSNSNSNGGAGTGTGTTTDYASNPSSTSQQEQQQQSRDGNGSANTGGGGTTTTERHYEHYESEYDDGEHVDKLIRQTGIGIFVRKITKETKTCNRTSNSSIQKERWSSLLSTTGSNVVALDDYILRPITKLDLNFSFFYPYPPEKRRKKKVVVTNTTTTATETIVENDDDSTPTTEQQSIVSGSSSRQRRGKRDKIPKSRGEDDINIGVGNINNDNMTPNGLNISTGREPGRRPGRLRRSRSSASADSSDSFLHSDYDSGDGAGMTSSSFSVDLNDTGSANINTGGDGYERKYHIAQRLRTPLRGSVGGCLNRNISHGSYGGASGAAGSTAVGIPIELYSPTIIPDQPAIETSCASRLQCRVNVDDVNVVFTTRHYELLNYTMSTIARMQNGRPDRSIRSVKETEPGTELRRIMKQQQQRQQRKSDGDWDGDDGKHHNDLTMTATTTTPAGIISSWWASDPDANKESLSNDLSNLGSDKSNNNNGSGSFSSSQQHHYHQNHYYDGKVLKSARQEVIVQWWKYSFGAITWEIRKRKHMTSMFRNMYISFDWNKQRYRRKEYIDLYIRYKLDTSTTTTTKNATTAHGGMRMGATSFTETATATATATGRMNMNIWSTIGGYNSTKQKEAEELLSDIEDELPIEQILLYRSIARSMRVRGKTTKMPSAVSELWGVNGLKGAEFTRRQRLRRITNSKSTPTVGGSSSRYSATATATATKPPRAGGAGGGGTGVKFGSDTAFINRNSNRTDASFDTMNLTADGGDENDSTLLELIQNQSEVSQRLREKGGVQEYFGIPAATGADDGSDDFEDNNDDDISNTDAAKTALENNNNKATIGGISMGPSLSAGNFYSSGGTKRDFATIGDGRTIRSNRFGRYSNRGGGFLGSTAGDTTIAKRVRTTSSDNRMRHFFSFQIKKFNLIVVEEDYLFELSPEMRGMSSSNRSLCSDSSELHHNLVDDLSVLTDDQDDGEIGMIVEEEEEEEEEGIDVTGAKMRSTDFLSFGHPPEKSILRLTITSLTTTAKGISGEGMQLGLSVARIEAVGDQDTHILSMGGPLDDRPVTEVDIDGSVGYGGSKKRNADAGSVDASTLISGKHQTMADTMIFTRFPSSPPRHAVSLKFTRDGPSNKTLQIDLSKIYLSVNLVPAAKLLNFYNGPDVNQPETLLTMSSRDVARKIMVKKIADGPTSAFAALSSAIRIHGVEIRVPYSFNEESDSEDSELDSSFIFSHGSEAICKDREQRNYSLYLESDIIELYSGNAVDELIQSSAMMFKGGKDNSVASESISSSRKQTVIKTLDMLNIAELAGTHDSFTSNHFVFTMDGMRFGIDAKTADIVPSIMEIPINIEVLITRNELSLLDIDCPKQNLVVEVSPIEFLLSKDRLDLLSAAKPAFDFGKLNTKKKRIKPDPPRIEILSHRILSSLDFTCKRLRIELVKDTPIVEALLPSKMKEIVMEETLCDFLSVVACFDLSLPNEEALSSAMQVCIGRLVGLGLNDDEAWACANKARLNFLDDIALMRKTQSDLFHEIAKTLPLSPTTTKESIVEDDDSVSHLSRSFANADGGSQSSGGDSISGAHEGDDGDFFDEFSDDDSKNSTHMVETTIKNAVEKTVSSFSSLLPVFFEDDERLDDSTFLFFDLPTGFSLSSINMFYDQMVTSLVPSLVVTNKAGIELLTLVPYIRNETSVEEDGPGPSNRGISFSRFSLDKKNDFGRGGLPISVLASNEGAEKDLPYRERSRLDDIEIGELEFFFSSRLFEDIIDEITTLIPTKQFDEDLEYGTNSSENENEALDAGPLKIETSTVIIASCLSFLFTSDALVPFSRLTLEGACYKNEKAMESLDISETPSFALVAKSFTVQNLTPEGQLYPIVLALLSPDGLSSFPFQVRYFKSPDQWKISSRLEVEFTSFRLFLVRQFINDLLQYFCYENYGVGRLKKKYETKVTDVHGNERNPLLYSCFIYDSSILCPRNSTSSDILAFEIEDACFAVSYIPETFAMPTETSPFDANPMKRNQNENCIPNGKMSRDNSFISLSDYEDCESAFSEEPSGPISSYTSDLIRRFTISIEKFRVFTAIADDKATQNLINSSLFRWLHKINGRAEDSKSVYKKENNLDENSGMEKIDCIQSWEEISTDALCLEILADSAPHSRLLISSRDGSMPFLLNARLSQLCLLLAVWDSNMQELGTVFKVSTDEVFNSARPPTIPYDFPEYSSEKFVSYLERIKSIRSEICCIFKRISIRCTFDEPNHFSIDPKCFQYFEDPDCADDVKAGLILSLDDAVIHVLNNHLNVKRIGLGASSINLTDERRVGSFQGVLSSNPALPNQISWADLSWGLREDARTLDSSLPQPFQASVFMTPGWSMTNLGIQSAGMVMHDLSWIWVILDYFKSYFTDPAFGNPGFEAQKWSHRIKNALRRSTSQDVLPFVPLPGLNVDFRLWLIKPILCLPSDYFDSQAPSLIISSDTGLWYRYKSIEQFSSQEIVSTDMNLSFANEFVAPERFGSSGTIGLRPLIKGLSFGLRYDSNNKCNHKDVSVIVPFLGENIPSCSVVGQELEVDPLALAPPKVLKPFQNPTRQFGNQSCDITCVIECLPLTAATMQNFFSGPSEINKRFAPQEEDNDESPQTFSVSAKVGDVRMFLIAPDLGVQLPIARVSLSSSSLTMSKFAIEPITKGLTQGESQPSDLQITLCNHLWIDNFKLGLTRSWEPLIEPFEFQILYEVSNKRGQGISINSDCPLHFNLSGALLSFLSETIDSFRNVIRETFEEKNERSKTLHHGASIMASSINQDGALVKDITKTIDGHEMEVIHEIPKTLKGEDRVAFSIRNLTGQRLRIHQQQSNVSREDDTEKPVVVTYLNQGEAAPLTFDATISVVKNMRVVEVPIYKDKSHQKVSLHHAIDLQVPGCRWIQNVSVDTFGRKFQILIPRSPQVCSKILNDWRLQNAMTLLTEVGPDNGGRLLSVRSSFEIVNNTTHIIKLVSHPDPIYKPDLLPKRTNSEGCNDNGGNIDGSMIGIRDKKSEQDCDFIRPNCSFQLPTLLLESALEMAGGHLGSVWMCPDTSNTKIFSFRDFSKPTESSKIEEFDVDMCSRPIQLAKIVDETSLLYQNGGGEDIGLIDAKSGLQVSCPTQSISGNMQTPFCYAIEIGRSPIVKSNNDPFIPESQDSKGFLIDTGRKNRRSNQLEKFIHGPVAYSLAVYPPIVIVNLLPQGGRFELMHAIRKTVVWYADLEPGQQAPIHSLGLDIPLLIMVNLGFCRTPVGEGAIVHHGGDAAVYSKEQNAGLKSIGKAVSKGTKKIGKTLTTLADSPDKRAKQRVAKMATPKAKGGRKKRGSNFKQRSSSSLGLDIGEMGAESGDGKVHAIEAVSYSTSDIATETTVVDGAGQRLTLHIENIRGGGGQRRVSLYCPYWIVNTTEHALRYKEDKEKRFVSGTVISPEKDGSVPVDGSNRHYRSRHEMQSKRRVALSSPSFLERNASLLDNMPMNPGNIFAGTHGGLATSPGRCNLPPENVAALIDKDMPLHQLAEMAFMFNFYEDGLGVEKLIVQLYDAYNNSNYVSGWSTGFGLATVGFSQVIRVPCKDGRMLELSATVNVAPGFLSGYTKIVRFCPRYVVYNRLERPIRLWQDSSILRPLSEDRRSDNNTSGGPSDSRKWRYGFEDKHHKEKIDQYESVFGRFATINDGLVKRQDGNRSEIIQIIPGGTTAHRSAQYVSSIGPSELVPFFLPDTRSESQLRIDCGGPWILSSSFSSNIPGEHVLPISRATDLRMLTHVSTRAAPKYKITLPPPADDGIIDWDGELGAYFETEWISEGDRKILVKGTKRGKYAFNHTDIHIGDELLRINGISVLKMTFHEAMKTIKDVLSEFRAYRERIEQKSGGELSNPQRVLRRLSLVPKRKQLTATESGEEDIEPVHLTLTFRTQEERLRKLRIKAIKTKSSFLQASQHAEKQNEDSNLEPIDALTVETKALHNTMFVIIRGDDKENPPYKIQNRSSKYFLFFRQRNCEDHDWNILMPGESTSYTWEEPMKSKKLTVRIAVDRHETPKEVNNDELSIGESDLTNEENSIQMVPEDKSANAVRADRLRQILAYQYVDNEERGGFGLPTTVRLEEIGFQSLLPVPSFMEALNEKMKYLHCEVDTDGGTRLLIITEFTGESDDRKMMNQNIESLQKQILNEEERCGALQNLKHVLTQPIEEEPMGSASNGQASEEERSNAIEDEIRELVDDFPEGNISKRFQLVVQVLEAVGLSSSHFVGSPSPYCEVFLKGRSRSRKNFLQKRKNKRKTYFVEKSLRPRWNDQYFVFDVPEEAIEVTRGHSIQIIVRDFRNIGQHPVLGQASMHFASVRNQRELVGWWPLVGKHTDVSVNTVSDFGRGSVKLRAQWIYTVDAMIDYYTLLSQRRLLSLTQTEKGMLNQLKYAEESFERKREAMDRLPGGRITKLVKLQKKAKVKTDAAMKRERIQLIARKTPKKESRKSDATDTNNSLNNNFLQLRDTLKFSRKQSLRALNDQTVESKRKRQLELKGNGDDGAILDDSAGVAKAGRYLRKASSFSNSKENESTDWKPSVSPATRDRTQSLGDHFARVRSSRRGGLELSSSQHRSHRKLSLEVDDLSFLEVVDQSSHQLSSLFERHGLSDSDLSSNSDAQEQARKKNDIARLMRLGFVFHELGQYFHEDHLPNHFRRLLFGNSLVEEKSELLYSRKLFVGTSSSIRYFKNWQAASAILWDPELDVVITDGLFSVRLNDKTTIPDGTEERPLMGTSKHCISQKLQVPKTAARVTIERSKYRIETMQISRTSFDRSSNRILGCVLNLGGWLTLRPIAAMNLPDSYTGMFVKISHGSEIQVSETVDAKVSPKWLSTSSANPSKANRRRTSAVLGPAAAAAAVGFEFSDNDLHLHVEPQQTGGSIRLSVVAERYKKHVELGVVNIPIGTAIATCIDAAQDMEMPVHSFLNDIPMYTRWFPLTESNLTLPVAGDMGLSGRPQEHEQLRDHMFSNYFSPCIQLSLIWWPDDQNQNENNDESEEAVDAEQGIRAQCRRESSTISRITRIPASIQSYFNADISMISVALIDTVRAKELLNLTMLEIDVKYAVTKTKTRVGLVIGWIQMDQQQDDSREPVVFAPTPSEYQQPTLQFLALKNNLWTKSNIVSYEYIGVLFQEMDLTVEEPRVYELWDFFLAVMRRKKLKKRAVRGQQHADVVSRNENIFTAVEVDESVAVASLFSIIQSAGDRSAKKKKVYVEQFILGLVKINLSYVKGKRVSESSSDDNINMNTIQDLHGEYKHLTLSDTKNTDLSEVYLQWSQLTDDDNTLESSGAHNLPGIIAAVFPSVSDAPIRLQGKLVQHVFESPVEIVSNLKDYYTNETLKQVYKIIGSLDFVGNPTILLSSFMSGVKDLVSAPTAAFVKNPTDVKQVGIGVGKGTVSLFSHSTSGFFGFTARLFSQAGQAMAFFSLDSEYRQWHRERIVNEATNLERVFKRRGIQNADEMLLRPITDVVLGISLGVSGVVMSPYRGARKGGTKGFLIGTGVGVAGLITKPVVGVFDALTHGAQSVHDIAKSVNFLERRYQQVQKLRLPYVFGLMKILRPFDDISARSIYLLGMFPPKTKLKRRLNKRRELHIYTEVLSMEPGVETYAIATSIRVVLIKIKRDSNNAIAPTFGWEVDISSADTDSSQKQLNIQGRTISSRVSVHGHNGVAFTITKCEENVPTSKNLRRESRMKSENTPRIVNPSSGFFPQSKSLNEGDEELDESGGDLGSNFLQLDSNSSVAKQLTDSVTTGVTTKGNKTLEWFTVLAEYQHRQQLTRLHNVLSCIVGDYDAVISDRIHAQNNTFNNTNGTTTFNIYNFESGLPDGRAAQLSNTKVIASLENLHWMEHNLVHRISGLSSSSRKERALAKVRRNWDYSNDRKASMNLGGPDWLIEARAKAMAVPRQDEQHSDHVDADMYPCYENSPMLEVFTGFEYDGSNSANSIQVVSAGMLVPRIDGSESNIDKESSDPHSFSAGNLMATSEDGLNANSFEAVDASKHTMSSSEGESQSYSRRNMSAASINTHESNDNWIDDNDATFRSTVDSIQSSEGRNMEPNDTTNQATNGNDDGDDAEEDIDRDCDYNMLVQDFHSPINGRMDDNGQVEIFDHDHQQQLQQQQHPPPLVSLYATDTAPTAGLSTLDDKRTNVDSRIDRLEGVMEQLVLLNAAQAQRDAAAAVAVTRVSSSDSQHSAMSLNNSAASVHEIADTLKQELVVIRGQIEQRAKDDEALRQEISMLRDQLADRRQHAYATRGNTEGSVDNNDNDSRRRPPPVNTHLFRTATNPIKGLFRPRNNRRQPPQPRRGNNGSADTRNEDYDDDDDDNDDNIHE